MTETIKYQSPNAVAHARTTGLRVRRQALLRRYGGLLSSMTSLGKIFSNVQFNLACGALSCNMSRRSR